MGLSRQESLSIKSMEIKQFGSLNIASARGLLLVYAGFLLLLIYLFAPLPSAEKPNAPADINPIFLRASSGPFHTLLADQRWLLSARLDETVKPDQQPDQQSEQGQAYFRQMASIIELDPGFSPGLRYATTYLASIYREVELAHALLDIAIRYYPDNIDLRVFKIAQEIGYQSSPRVELISRWIEELESMTDQLPEWLGGAGLYALKKKKQRELQREDLLWLLDNSSSDIEKKAILKRLEVLASEV